ncbi:TssQ family T6SS-associated lipoprotein [Diaphorobacter sp. HDW4A]|uniref:TssQ family T6SS-associated lipoprotein n=1 Tax=Diaphorobacter sp. HDW4A TaxID=2714924 RepID=UPI00140E8250|nr:TssQ family T6SS-associated lipoprotein [Diaphorobacter sp. HDW4A]QIL80307.1 TssQ family T6SS-associated lipoprotein [Diaphorobacter sp. HDW4A]
MSKRIYFLAPLMVAVLAVTGCDTAPKKVEPPPPPPVQAVEPEPVAPPASRAERVEAEPTATNNTEALTGVERRFAEGLNQYNDGNYPNAIRIFREPIFSRAWPELQVKSLKYLAFSFCLNNNPGQCRSTFVQLLKLKPDFDLSEAESGHPGWGPVFKQAKADVAKSGVK